MSNGSVHIVTDSACDLSSEEVEDLGVTVVPLSIRFGSEEFTDRTELSVADFYNKMANNDHLPETAAPSPGAFEDAFRAAADAGASEILCINLSSDLSATMGAARTAAKAFDGELPVEIHDSKSITSGLGTQVREAVRMANDGSKTAEIVDHLNDLQGRQVVWGLLDTLDNLKKGGRIGGAQAMIGSLLQIKPVIDISTGAVEEFSKQRTRKKAVDWLLTQIREAGAIEHLCLMHGMAPDFDAMMAKLGEERDTSEIHTGHIGAVIGAHGGPRVIGATFIKAK